ncbi:hypothetical protein KUL72_14085 [Bradyrhizobium arachidis]|nr:hypothetical protein [Bradyrhizobium arachidis]UVO40438.1 hypothetical protein KUL72_14085 [Bradyrhizobium arachidis]
MRSRRPLMLTGAFLTLAVPCGAQTADTRQAVEQRSDAPRHIEHRQPMTDILALMSGKCTTLKIAGQDYACKAVAYAHTESGRVSFAVALEDPADDSHVVSFSGENGKRFDDNSYELPVDRMLLNSRHRPKVHGLPVPAEEASTGVCRQFGNFAARKVSNVTCTAIDSRGQRYELLFVSDGTPIGVRRVRQSAPSINDPFK